MMDPSRSTKVVMAVALPAALLAACGNGDDNGQKAYCVDKNNKVVNDSQCDTSRGGPDGLFFMMLPGSSNYSAGNVIPRDKGYSRFSVTDQQARVNAGLKATGKVSSGTKVGGIGKGSSGGKIGSGGS